MDDSMLMAHLQSKVCAKEISIISKDKKAPNMKHYQLTMQSLS